LKKDDFMQLLQMLWRGRKKKRKRKIKENRNQQGALPTNLNITFKFQYSIHYLSNLKFWLQNTLVTEIRHKSLMQLNSNQEKV